jgi:lysozyme
MKTRAALFLGITALLLIVLTTSFFFGGWIPNFPNPSRYPVRGIDVSAHQGRIDWKRVAAGGISFAYLKATEGGDFRDAAFKGNLEAAREAGVACGAYHFFRFTTPGAAQAENFIRTVPREEVALPPAIDLEYWGNSADRPSPEAFQAELRTYVDAITKAYGRKPVFYTASDFSSVYLKDFPLRQLWIRDILLTPDMDGTKSWLFWQFSEEGTVPGIAGFIDLDVFNGSAESLHPGEKTP